MDSTHAHILYSSIIITENDCCRNSNSHQQQQRWSVVIIVVVVVFRCSSCAYMHFKVSDDLWLLMVIVLLASSFASLSCEYLNNHNKLLLMVNGDVCVLVASTSFVRTRHGHQYSLTCQPHFICAWTCVSRNPDLVSLVEVNKKNCLTIATEENG